MRRHAFRWPLIAALLGFFTVSSVPMLQSMTLYVYDLDSLVHLSTEVVDGEIARTYKAHDLDLIDVKVTHSYKGGFDKGQTVAVAAAEFFRKPRKRDLNSQPLAVGDRLVLFLIRAKSKGMLFHVPEDAVIYMPLPGGMRLIQEDRVFGFSQWGNPGPYVANVSFDPAKSKGVTVEQFRAQVQASLRDNKELVRLVEAKPDEWDVPRLLKLIASRTKPWVDSRDYFTERICQRFAEAHDPVLLSRALAVATAYHEVSILQRGFGTPKGRDYLLAKVADDTEPMPARLRYSHALAHAGAVYRSTFTEITANSWKPVEEAGKDNAQYLVRIAKTARALEKYEELCRSLIYCLDYFGQGIVQNKPAPLIADLRGAWAVLKEFYETKPTERLQFAIETATAWDRDAYEKLQSPCSIFISILRPVDPTKYTKPKKRSLIFEYEYVFLRGAEVQPSLVLVHSQTKKTYVLPTKLRFRGCSRGGGSDPVELPEDLPAGRYRAFFQLSDGDKVISTGHYFMADLR